MDNMQQYPYLDARGNQWDVCPICGDEFKNTKTEMARGGTRKFCSNTCKEENKHRIRMGEINGKNK